MFPLLHVLIVRENILINYHLVVTRPSPGEIIPGAFPLLPASSAARRLSRELPRGPARWREQRL